MVATLPALGDVRTPKFPAFSGRSLPREGLGSGPKRGENEEYHPYGTTAWHAANSAIQVSAKRYRYTGKEKDEETGLSYHGARYYAPWLGRWTSADPAGMVDGPNWYAYVQGNPVGGRDPTGLSTQVYDRTDPVLVTGGPVPDDVAAQVEAELQQESAGAASSTLAPVGPIPNTAPNRGPVVPRAPSAPGAPKSPPGWLRGAGLIVTFGTLPGSRPKAATPSRADLEPRTDSEGPDRLEAPDVDVDEDSDRPAMVNLDTGTLILLSSERADMQATRREIATELAGNQVLVTESVAAEFTDALKKHGNEAEIITGSALLAGSTIIPDAPSSDYVDPTLVDPYGLRLVDRIGAVDVAAFGTGEQLGITTYTGDARAVRKIEGFFADVGKPRYVDARVHGYARLQGRTP